MVVEGEQVVVGDTEARHAGIVEYEVLCRRHYMRRMTSHAARAARRLARGAALRPRRVPAAAAADHPGRLRAVLAAPPVGDARATGCDAGQSLLRPNMMSSQLGTLGRPHLRAPEARGGARGLAAGAATCCSTTSSVRRRSRRPRGRVVTGGVADRAGRGPAAAPASACSRTQRPLDGSPRPRSGSVGDLGRGVRGVVGAGRLGSSSGGRLGRLVRSRRRRVGAPGRAGRRAARRRGLPRRSSGRSGACRTAGWLGATRLAPGGVGPDALLGRPVLTTSGSSSGCVCAGGGSSSRGSPASSSQRQGLLGRLVEPGHLGGLGTAAPAALGAALAHGGHEVDGLALAAPRRRRADAALGLDVVDAARTVRRREVRGRDRAGCLLVLVLAEPARLVVDGGDGAGERVEAARRPRARGRRR